MTHIHTEVYGQGKAIVLIHGWAMHTGVWRLFAQQLAKQYRVILVDLPGHGLSENVEPYTLDKVSRALIKVVSEPIFSVLGWSLGASVAITIAKQFPGRVNSLILLAGNPRFVKSEDWSGVQADFLMDFSSRLKLNYQATIIRFLALQVKGSLDSKCNLKLLKKITQECELPTESVLLNCLKLLQFEDLRSVLASLKCSISVIQGDKDALIPAQVSLDIQQLQPACKVHLISQASHVPFLSHQAEVIEIINKVV